jgi:hypothetical protein
MNQAVGIDLQVGTSGFAKLKQSQSHELWEVRLCLFSNASRMPSWSESNPFGGRVMTNVSIPGMRILKEGHMERGARPSCVIK